MTFRTLLPSVARWCAAGIGIAAVSYGGYVALTWSRYGNTAPPTGSEQDPLLERFIPRYEVVERHQVRVMAPAAVTLAAAREIELQASWLIRTIIRAREVI